MGPLIWNGIPEDIQEAGTILTFKKHLKDHIFNQYRGDPVDDLNNRSNDTNRNNSSNNSNSHARNNSNRNSNNNQRWRQNINQPFFSRWNPSDP